MRVSISIGLSSGRDKIRTLYVPRKLDPELEVIGTALFIVGVELQFVDGEWSNRSYSSMARRAASPWV